MTRPLSSAGYATAAFVFLLSASDTILAVLPATPAEVGWRFGAFGVAGRGLVGPYLALFLALDFFVGAGAPVLEPLYLTIALLPGSTGTAAQLGNDGFSYAASGYRGTSGTQLFVTSGNVTSTYVPPVVAPPPVTATPEPVTMALLGSGLLGLGAYRRRRRTPT